MTHKFVKLDERAFKPTKRDEDNGFDLVAISKTETLDYIEYDTGVGIKMLPDHACLALCRSSVSKYDLALCNGVGLIDGGYKGSIKYRFKKTAPMAKTYEIGDKIGQIIIVPCYMGRLEEMTLEEFNKIESERQDSGFGSTGG